MRHRRTFANKGGNNNPNPNPNQGNNSGGGGGGNSNNRRRHNNNRRGGSGGGRHNNNQQQAQSNNQANVRTDGGNRHSQHNQQHNNQVNFLPSPQILQEYEYAAEGTVDRILEMAEVEQDRRNKWEDEYLAYYKKSLRIGQLFGFVLMLSVVMATVLLAFSGKEEVAKILAGSAFIAVAVANLFSESARKLSKRPKR